MLRSKVGRKNVNWFGMIHFRGIGIILISCGGTGSQSSSKATMESLDLVGHETGGIRKVFFYGTAGPGLLLDRSLQGISLGLIVPALR
jgi:hypothetical protein